MTGGKTVLLVEDDPDLHDVARAVLEDLGYSVLSAINGKVAIERLSGNPSLLAIILDLSMPVMNGWEFLAWAELHLGSVPVIVTSAAVDCAEAKRRHRRVVACLRKPFSIEELDRALRVSARG